MLNIILLILLCCLPLHSQQPYSSSDALLQGFDSFKAGDWTGASLFLRRALADKENVSEAALYMLIMASLNRDDYADAFADCIRFEKIYPDSDLIAYVLYQKGRCLYYMGQHDQSLLVLSDFCHSYPGNEMQPLALYYLAECFYDDCKYDEAKSLYTKIVTDFPHNDRVELCLLRLELLAQHEREEKLLYLLKLTSQESLSAREFYEKQLKLYQGEDLIRLKKQLEEAEERIKTLEASLNEQSGD